MKKITEQIKNTWLQDEVNHKNVHTVNPPIYQGSTVMFDNYDDFLDSCKPGYDKPIYGTDRFPVQRQFEQALCRMEHGSLTRAFPSGLAAIQNTFFAFTKTGDHALIVDNAYGPGTLFCKKILSNFGIDVTPVPPAIGADITDHIKPNTKLILLESPGSNTFEIQNIPKITKIAREKGILTALDNTWATPLYLDPFKLGVDISIQSVTKYISGHSDVLLGTVSCNDKTAPQFGNYYRTMELFASEHACYLALRGLKTLSVRLKQHEQSALSIARHLESENLINEVIHPALPCHPEHHLWKRDFSGSSGLFAFTFKEDYSKKQIGRFLSTLELFKIGYSWGGYKSLITAGKQARATPSRYQNQTIIRLNIGLEDPDDLINDLEAGFRQLASP